MVECTACGASEFECIDAMYFCTTCQTLSQIHGVEQENDQESALATYSHFAKVTQAAHISKVPDTEANESDRPKIDLGRPWRTHEAFQCILKEQVLALLKLNANPKLKDNVFRVWMLYLRVCGIAFRDKPLDPEKQKLLNLNRRIRDKYPGTMKDPQIKAVRQKITRQKKLRSKQLNKSQDDDKEMEDGDEEVDPYIVTDENEEIQKLIAAEERDMETYKKLLDDDIVYDSEGFPLIKKSEIVDILGEYHQLRSQMTLIKTLGLIYIALQYTNNEVMPHDLVRFIKQGKLPYVLAYTLLPENMKFCQHDYKIFCTADVPTGSKIQAEAEKLAAFMGVEVFPEIDVKRVIHRYLLELGLPGRLHAIIANLLRKRKPTVSLRHREKRRVEKDKCYNVDIASLAMSYVVIVLKLVFGLDDVTEWNQSRYGEILASYIDFDPPLFIWSHWVSFAEKERMITRGRCFPKDVKDTRLMQDVDTALTEFDRLTGNAEEYRSNSLAYSKFRCQIRKEMTHCLNRVYENVINSKDDDINSLPDPFADDSQDEREEVVNNTEKSIPKNHTYFQRSTIEHILRPEKFMESFGEENYEISNNEMTSSDVIYDEYDLFSNERKCSSKPRNKQKILRRPGTSLQEIIEQLPCPLAEIGKACENYTLYEIVGTQGRHNESVKGEAIQDCYKTKISKKHVSYDWLLGICSDLIGNSIDNLHDYVQRLELVCIVDEVDMTNAELVMRRLFLSKCFSSDENEIDETIS